MDANLEKQTRLRVKNTLKNLELNLMNAAYVETKEDALKLVQSMVSEGSLTASGGSVTLNECGIIDFLKEKTNYLDRFQKGMSKEDKREIELKSFSADYYLLSANAITEHGEIYEVDGNANRVAALAYGPEKVIIVAGINKLVPSLRAAVERTKRVAAPSNCIRLGIDSYCSKAGVCVQSNFDENNLMCDKDCGNSTICSDTLILKKQSNHPRRITVILVGENLGY